MYLTQQILCVLIWLQIDGSFVVTHLYFLIWGSGSFILFSWLEGSVVVFGFCLFVEKEHKIGYIGRETRYRRA